MNLREINKLNEELNKLTEDSSSDLDDELDMLQEVIGETQETFKNIYDRVIYRTKENVSYFGEDAVKKVFEVEQLIEKTMEELYKKAYLIVG